MFSYKLILTYFELRGFEISDAYKTRVRNCLEVLNYNVIMKVNKFFEISKSNLGCVVRREQSRTKKKKKKKKEKNAQNLRCPSCKSSSIAIELK